METANLDYAQEMMADVIDEHIVKKMRSHQCGLRDDEMIMMARMICHQEVGICDICNNVLHCDPRQFYNIRQKEGFPKPFKEVGHQPFWWLDDIEIWLYNEQKKKGSK